MPRKSRKKTTEATGPEISPEANAKVDAMYAGIDRQIQEATPLAGTLEKLKKDLDLKTAAEIPIQLPPPELILERLPRSEQAPPDRELVQPAPEQARPRPSHRLNGEEREQTTFAEKVAARRPNFRPVPNGYKNVERHESAGIRVNKGIERENFGTAALQFSEDRPLSRASEYDLMEQVQKAGFQFKPITRQWERPKPEGMAPGENVIDGVRLAKEIADARGVGPGR